MDTPNWKLPAYKAAIPPTPESTKPQSSPAAESSSVYAPPSSPYKLPNSYHISGMSSSPTKRLSAFNMSSTPASDLETPRARRSTSNRFWEKNDNRSKGKVPGIELASDSSDPEDDSKAALTKKLATLDFKIKRLLVLETSRAVRLKSMAANEAVMEYEKLLEAFAQKPKTKKKRTHDTNALLAFLQEHFQITEIYNDYAKIDRKLKSDRVLPEFIVEEEYEDDDEDAEGGTGEKGRDSKDKQDLRRAPAKHSFNNKEESDEEGIVTQTLKSDQFDGPSVFNTRGIKVPSIFNQKTSAKAERNQRRSLLHRREVSSAPGDDIGGREKSQDLVDTPTRPRKKRKTN